MSNSHTPPLNPQQQEAVSHIEGPLLVLAGAGSGKTRIVTARIVHLLSQGIPARSILGVTFTNKAAQEMQERVHKLTASQVLISTFHSLGVKILRESIGHLGYKPGFAIYDEDDSLSLVRSALEAVGVKNKEIKPKVIRDLISDAKSKLKLPEDLLKERASSPIEEAFFKAYPHYQAKLLEYQAVDFDDLLLLPVRLFKEHPTVRSLYQDRWQYLLIDEYQDTNSAQYLLARFLVERSSNLFAVGDPDQSIYSWRGANIENILNFERDYRGAKIVFLEENYRSRSNILNAANSLIKNNQNRYEKNLWSRRGDGEKIGLYIGHDDRDEAAFIIDSIDTIAAKEKLELDQFAIFYRTNSQSRSLEDALLRRRIPYTIVGGLSFYQRREIKDILAFLKIVHLESDAMAFERTINLPKRGIGGATVEKILQLASEENMPILSFCRLLLSANHPNLKLTTKQKSGLESYVQLITYLQTVAANDGIKDLVMNTIRESRYLDYIKSEDPDTFEDRKENLEQLISKAYEWQETHGSSTLQSFLEELCLKSSLDEAAEEEGGAKVQLMTLHNGKGLEFPVVFLVGMEEDLLPHVNSRDSAASIEEERRLCYVGMTRAKERLFLTAARSRFLWGTPRIMYPSRFLKEIHRDYIQRL